MELPEPVPIRWITAFSLLLVLITIKLYRVGQRASDLPPGPPALSVLSSLLARHKKIGFRQMVGWAQEFGEIFSLVGGPGGTVVVLTSPKAIHEVLEKQGSVTADRPQTVVINLVFGGRSIGSSNCNAFWKATRRAAADILRPQICAQHLSLQVAESNQLMFDILHAPQDTYTHVQRLATSVLLSVMFGQRAPRHCSPVVEEFSELGRRNGAILSHDRAQLLQMFPILRYLPERLAPWKGACRALRQDTLDAVLRLLRQVEERCERGQPNGCHMETLLAAGDSLELTLLLRLRTNFFGWTMMGAGTGSISPWFHFFILCMTAHPHVQAKAQEEIDHVVGGQRAPRLEDLGSLPYVQAVIKEVSRFRPVFPTHLPHVASTDIFYNGYRIPSGSVIHGNVWGVFHDERLFLDAESFNPERFFSSPYGLRAELQADDQDAFKRLNMLPFGSGRRACPAVPFAQQMLAINVMNLLWGFTFHKALDPLSGKELEVDLWAFTPSAVFGVLPFTFRPIVRDTNRSEIIERNYVASSEVFELFERELSLEDRQYVNEKRTKTI